MSESLQPSETEHVFLHQEGDLLVAYHGGREIARREKNGQERFLRDMHVWMRKTRYSGPLWRVTASGGMERAEDLEKAAKNVFAAG